MAQDHLPQSAHGRPSPRTALERLATGADRAARITHTEHLPPRVGRHAFWPGSIRPEVEAAIAAAGIVRPWEHQALAAQYAAGGESVVVATGTASGKSLGYLAPVLSALLDGVDAPGAGGRGATALYLAPTKALAADQRRAVSALAAPLGTAIRPAVYDGDTPVEEREWVRQYATYVLTNPDMLHRGILPGHARWSSFLRHLRYVVIDECHTYRGVFGSHVAQVLRRLRRVCARYGAEPVFLLASATAADPARAASRLTGVRVVEVTDDASPRGELAFALWEPPLTRLSGERGAPVRRTATAEAAELLTDLVLQGVRTVAFVRSRRGAELVALMAQERLAEIDPSLPARVAAYRGGYLPEERRALERDLHSGRLLGLASTSALELGVDISGLDAVILAGYPGTRASLWQQAGRAGRSGQGALAVMVGRDDPLDTYLVHHPEAIFEQPVESTVLDPDNPYVLAPHLCAAAAELPLTEDDLALFGPEAPALVAQLERRGLLRRRAAGWYWTRRERASDLTDIRGEGGKPIQVVESSTGRLLGTVDASSAHTAVHDGAVHLHQGRTYLVERLDLEDGVALVARTDPPYSTMARDTTAVRVLSADVEEPWGEARIHFGSVEVTHQVVSYLRRRLLTGEVLGETKLDLPPRTLRTRAVWWTVTDDQLDAAGIHPEELPGALHAAEHASIGLLPLFATCDRWDIGGVSVPLHADTGLPTVFVYDGHPGGAGFAERAFHTARTWLTATREAIAACECEFGCPSCVQSPKCGNGNDPLDKAAAVRLLTCLLSSAPGAEGPAVDPAGLDTTPAPSTPSGGAAAGPVATSAAPGGPDAEVPAGPEGGRAAARPGEPRAEDPDGSDGPTGRTAGDRDGGPAEAAPGPSRPPDDAGDRGRGGGE
ncbi:DEAD/DEAH box helicase [Actinacidiphila paucisporea]|uniref:DEAD/DEAH box helicase domain-containing protein n=1 Tax=Actinacidiphila paucisporea TaxID=310782 RepID=A0A1M7QJU2_9ACTN|nr:DEAD/DEAH box helicase [Actinacidiphila paucisporea]SHN31536.1 DEAD/DEAH box helicase domain-containing protein [Actinacidiphila paucisporea]